ncbi:glycosyltransferase family 3 protein [Scleroderma citrinum]
MTTTTTIMAEEQPAPKRDVQNHHLFECAWEVANKVGGIYTVISTKVPVTIAEYGDRYTLVGPLTNKLAMEVRVLDPVDPVVATVLEAMHSHGVKCLYGRWLIEDKPQVLLFDVGSCSHRLDEWKGDLWNLAGISTPLHDAETNNVILFGYLMTWFLGEYASRQLDTAIVVHFHEWQAGVTIPICRKRQIDVMTVFTTHATLLGRYLCAGSVDFYNNLRYFDVNHEAGKRGIYHRYCVERTSAHCADVFTTVSHITVLEAEYLLKRRPDGVVPNGLNINKFQRRHEHESENLYAIARAKIHGFMRGHFYGHYDFDLENTLYIFTAVRYEYRNKGLNYRLKRSDSKTTVVAFIMPASTNSYTIEAFKGQALVRQLQETVTEIQKRIGDCLLDHALRFHSEGKLEVAPSDLLSSEDQMLLKQRISALKRTSLPPFVTHNMMDDANDPILNRIRRVKLFNSHEDRVKIVFHPDFLTSSNPILGLDYEEFVRGCHLGVFTSYYEPRRYTPAECTVMGIPSITTNLSGFGCFIQDTIKRPEDEGCYIIDRRTNSFEQSVSQLTDCLEGFCNKTWRQRADQRSRMESLSLLDWKILGVEYTKSRPLALRRAYPDAFLVTDGESGEEDPFIAVVIHRSFPLRPSPPFSSS